MAIRVNKDGEYVISSGGLWLPGIYTSERAAKYAFRFSNDTLRQLQNEKNDKHADHRLRVISFEDLQAARKKGMR